ncbi:MAG: disulfide bond formation protein B [Thiotrichales bacterium]
MTLSRPRQIWLLIALGAAALAVGSLLLTAWLDLHPCHLCIFQRLLWLALAGFATLAFVWPHAIFGRLASLIVIVTGLGVAGYQSWLELQPPGTASCVGGQPGLIERLVEWLGEHAPTLFLATGFCDEPELSILGLTLANASLIGFTTFFVLALWAWSFQPNSRNHP